MIKFDSLELGEAWHAQAWADYIATLPSEQVIDNEVVGMVGNSFAPNNTRTKRLADPIIHQSGSVIYDYAAVAGEYISIEEAISQGYFSGES